MSSNSGEKPNAGKSGEDFQAGCNVDPESTSRRKALKTLGKLAYAAPTLSVLSLVKPAQAFSEPPHPDEYYFNQYANPPDE